MTNLESNTKPNVHERPWSMSPTNKHWKQGKNLPPTISKTSNTNNDKQQQKINELEEEIQRLKTTQKITAETTNIDHTKINHPPQQNSKNRVNRGLQENMNLHKVISNYSTT